MKMQKSTLRFIHFYLNDKEITEDIQMIIFKNCKQSITSNPSS